MRRHWQQGICDAQADLQASPWLQPMPKQLGVRVFDLT
jgi:NTE family protein